MAAPAPSDIAPFAATSKRCTTHGGDDFSGAPDLMDLNDGKLIFGVGVLSVRKGVPVGVSKSRVGTACWKLPDFYT